MFGLGSLGALGVPAFDATPRASLTLNFTNTSTLDSRITFSRGSHATYFDSTGVLRYAANNMLTYSEQFDNAAWTKASCSISANQTTAPDGTATADAVLAGDLISAEKRVTQAPSGGVVGTTYAFSIYAKKGAVDYIAVTLFDAGSNGVRRTFSLVDGSAGTNADFNTPSNPFASITNAGNGWWRITVGLTCAVAGVLSARFQPIAVNGSLPYVASSTTAPQVYIWGAQLEIGSTANTYNATTASAYYAPRFDYDPVTLAARGLLIEEQRTNLLFPASGSGGGWSASPASSVAATANAGTSPDGTSNATKLSANDTLNNGHLWFNLFAGAINTTYVASGYFKAADYSRVSFVFGNSAFANVNTGALFDLANGTVVATANSSTATITNVGNGWYRCAITGTTDADGGNYVIAVSPNPASVTTVQGFYTPASTGLGILAYGLQVETGSFATSLIPTTTAAVQRNADSATMTGTNFSSWYNATEGTVYAEAATVSLSASRAIFEGADASTFKDFSLVIDNTNSRANFTNRTVAGNYDVFAPNSSFAANTFYKLAGSYSATSADLAYGGSIAVSKAAAAQRISADRVWIGSRTGNSIFLNGWIRRIAYFPRRLSNAELQAITR